MLILPMLFGAFRPPKPAPSGPATVFPLGRENKNTQRLAARREAQPHWDDQSRVQILAPTWGRKMITVHEKMSP
jgi:hypothetical protein